MNISYERSLIITIGQISTCIAAFYLSGILALEFHTPQTRWNPSDSFGWYHYKIFIITLYGIGITISNLFVAGFKSKLSFWITYSILSILFVTFHFQSIDYMPYRTIWIIASGLVGIWSILPIQATLNYLNKKKVQNDTTVDDIKTKA